MGGNQEEYQIWPQVCKEGEEEQPVPLEEECEEGSEEGTQEGQEGTKETEETEEGQEGQEAAEKGSQEGREVWCSTGTCWTWRLGSSIRSRIRGKRWHTRSRSVHRS